MPSGADAAAATAADVEREATAARPSPTDARRLFFAVFPSIMLPMFLAAVDQTIVSTALPGIAASLGDVERISWVVVSYLVATTIAAPIYGRLGDVLGRKRLMFAALSIFIVASFLCAVAPTILALTAARVLQGFGGGGLMTLSQALVGEVVPPRERGRYQGYMASVFVCSSTFGPVAGGWLTQHFGWESIFLINLPLGALAILMAFRLPKKPAGGGRLKFDFLGTGLFACFIAPLLLALEQAQRFDARLLPLIVGMVAVAVVRSCCCCGRRSAPPRRCCRSSCSRSRRSGAPTPWRSASGPRSSRSSPGCRSISRRCAAPSQGIPG